MNISVISTCNLEGWKTYGERMARSFARYWPEEISLTIYAEDFNLPRIAPNIRSATFSHRFNVWKAEISAIPDASGRDVARNRRRVPYDFRRDCIRFSHKVAAIVDFVQRTRPNAGRLIWLDADTVAHASIDEAWLDGLFPAGADDLLAWLDRVRIYPECGFLMFNAEHSRLADFMRRLWTVYESGGVLELKETHDSYVIQQIAEACVREDWFNRPYSLSGPIARQSHHPFVLSPLGARLDHLKGKRKRIGRTPAFEAQRVQRGNYWR